MNSQNMNHDSMSKMDMSSTDMSGMDMSDMSMPGMDMSGMDHNHHSGHHHMDHVALFRRLFWEAVILAIPTVALDPMFAHLFGYSVPTTLPLTLIPAAFGTVMYFWTGKPFLSGAKSELSHRSPGMMTLISLGITVAFVASWCSTLGIVDSSLSFWWELALLIVIMLAGHWIEMASVMNSGSALDSISSLIPQTAHRINGTEISDIPVNTLKVGDIVIVRPGEAIPADGVITDGTAGINESMITGESMPVTHHKGDTVVAGSISTDSSLTIRVTAIGNDTALSTIRRLIQNAQNSKTPTQLLADKAAGLLFWYSLGAAAITAIVWLSLHQPSTALERVITVLVIACPHALGLAIPLVVSIAMGKAAQHGILFSKREALETLKNVTTVVFDKTGTLTMGSPSVVGISTVDSSISSDDLIIIAAAAERDSEHPLAKAIVTAAQEKNLTIPSASDFTSTPGVGVRAYLNQDTIEVGGPALLTKKDITEPSLTIHHSDATRLFVIRNNRVLGSIEIADTVRPEAKEAVSQLQSQGINVAMLTGDAQNVASAVAQQLGITQVFAHVLPADKDHKIAQLQSQGQTVAMVGDGVNDAPALARADIGIAIGAGTDVAINAADIVLARSNPESVVEALRISRLSVRKMHQNLWWAAGYNLISVPLAAGILSPIGFVLPMSVGAILMALSTVIVVINANLLKKEI